jgi:hypothetical protein
MSGFVCNIAINLEDSYTMRMLFPLYDHNGRRMIASRDRIDAITKFIRTNIPNIEANEYVTSIADPASTAYKDGVRTFREFCQKVLPQHPSVATDNNNPLSPLIYFLGKLLADAEDKGLNNQFAEFSMHRMGQTIMINHTLKDPNGVAESWIVGMKSA